MSFKATLAALTVIFVASDIAVGMMLSWADPGMGITTVVQLLVDYPPILLLIGGIVVAGLIADRSG